LSGSGCAHILVMGVAGSGKTSVATIVAREFDFEFIEGDEYHPHANVAKMAAGIPLTDEDRQPWLEGLARIVGERHARGQGTVLACSALRRRYRDILRSTVPRHESFVIELDADPTALRQRMTRRTGHFMPASLLESQLATFETLGGDERGRIVYADRPLAEVVAAATAAARRSLPA